MDIGRVNSLDSVSAVASSDCNKVKKSGSGSGSGSIVLSGKAREAAILKMAVSIAKAAPEIRFDKVEVARRSINDSLYLERVVDQTAEKILDAFGL